MFEEKPSYSFPRPTKASGTLLLDPLVLLLLVRDGIGKTLFPNNRSATVK